MPKAQSKAVNRPADYEQLGVMSKEQVQAEIVKLGADYHPAETKQDLMARLLQLQGVAQPIDKIRKDLQEHGIGGEGARTDVIPRLNKRLTPAELKKAAEKYVAKGMKLLIAKNGETWEIRFNCEGFTQGGKIVMTKRKDSGNTMIPIGVFSRACEAITTYTKPKRKDDNDAVSEDYEEIADDAA